ncbi:hypothetical protein B0T10DRAFT_209946 [Thelonectria olida]|uniref:Uncharacterized protein n=1 Tax=Thelonectria olida TaxID=1576542 RepID=A0A9P9ASW3_9HYPO|nr:hypothetical protein B0T10DRAFT_209946 [Thelonectria olida]
MTSYMDHLYPESRPPDAVWPSPPRVDSVPRSDQWAHLVACIVFACAVTSFLHRRKLYDPFQPYIFATCVSAAAVVGEWIGASADYIMLVHVSWAVCLAMLATSVSSRVHSCGHP